ncbi:MAG: DUF1987 domain-containing protein [Bacteroidales bacterium]|nr:DUF1987 domain-containing protein [Bacteroidales bacterium]MDD4671893.1 DUF1987 domain-containing protein [Bacteroidales bacterium]MDY0349429.1 DUF1987 domain-containing protein [Tenuifilaceae bacterium]
MKSLNIKGTQETPHVIFDKESGVFSMSGKSLPEDVKEFYLPIIEWVAEYAQTPNKETKFTVKMDYFNTASSKMILEVFELFKEIHDKGFTVVVDWYYQEDDEDMHDAGEDYADIVEVPFKLISYQQILE